jgi:hypothetical protein
MASNSASLPAAKSVTSLPKVIFGSSLGTLIE